MLVWNSVDVSLFDSFYLSLPQVHGGTIYGFETDFYDFLFSASAPLTALQSLLLRRFILHTPVLIRRSG